VIADGAHTPSSVASCTETFASLYGEGILLFGCAADKDAASMARILAPHFSDIIITRPGTFKTSFPEQVYRSFEGIARKVTLIPDTSKAIEQTLKLGREQGLPVLITGSFYLVGEAVEDAKKMSGTF
jgi:dihydrofolate synthase/folylpolyglutamate synthase